MIATAENMQAAEAKLPPNVRDFEIYRHLAIAGHSTRKTAVEFGLSQTRVRQVAARVVEFLVRAVPAELPEGSKEQRLFVAEQLAWQYLDFLYHEAVGMWRKSQAVTLDSPGGLGKICYLSAAARIVGAMAKLPLHKLPAFGPDPDEPDEPEVDPDHELRLELNAEIHEYFEQHAEERAEFEAAYPPVRDCSDTTVSRAPDAIPDYCATLAAGETCAALDRAKRAAFEVIFAPAQPAAARADPSTSEPPETRPALNRHQRRSREKLLRKKLEKR